MEKHTYQLTIDEDPDYVYLFKSSLTKDQLPEPLEIVRRLKIFDEESIKDFEDKEFRVNEIGNIIFDLDDALPHHEKPDFFTKDGARIDSLAVSKDDEGFYHIMGETDGNWTTRLDIPNVKLTGNQMVQSLGIAEAILVLRDQPNENYSGTPAWSFELADKTVPIFTPAMRPTDMQFIDICGNLIDELCVQKCVEECDDPDTFLVFGLIDGGGYTPIQDIPEGEIHKRDLAEYIGSYWANKILCEGCSFVEDDIPTWLFKPHTPEPGLDQFTSQGKPAERLCVTRNWEGLYYLEGLQGGFKVPVAAAGGKTSEQNVPLYLDSQQLISVIGEKNARKVFLGWPDEPNVSMWSFELNDGRLSQPIDQSDSDDTESDDSGMRM